MDARLKQLLSDYEFGKINQTQFLASLPADVQLTKECVSAEINAAIDQPDRQELSGAIRLLWVYHEHEPLLPLLHRLLLAPCHYHYQYITSALQRIDSPSSIPFIRAQVVNYRTIGVRI